MTTGDRIKAARKAAGMTQAELANKLGISYVGVSQWENDLRNPKHGTLQRIAAALGVDLLELMGYETVEKSTDAVIEIISQYQAICSAILDDDRIPDDVKRLIREELPKNPMAALSALSFHASEAREILENADENEPIIKIGGLLDKLNPSGQQKAVERVEELTEIPKYTKRFEALTPEEKHLAETGQWSKMIELQFGAHDPQTTVSDPDDRPTEDKK